MTVEKKDIDWGSLGFGYMKTDYSYEAHWKDGEWDEGGLTTDTPCMSPSAVASSITARRSLRPEGLHRRGRQHRLLPSRHER